MHIDTIFVFFFAANYSLIVDNVGIRSRKVVCGENFDQVVGKHSSQARLGV